MKFTCEKEILYNGLAIVGKAISTRTTHKSLEGILIETYDNMLKLTCTDLTIGIETIIPAKIAQEGKALVQGKIFSEFVRKLPEGEIKFTFENFNVHIDYGYSSTNLQTLDYAEFPSIPTVEQDNEIFIKEDKLRSMIMSTVFSAAIEDSRPVLTGALLDIKGSEAKIVCLDGYRLALSKEMLGDSYADVSIIIPAKTLTEVQKLLVSNSTVKLYVNESHVQFLVGKTKIISRLIEGEFIRYENIIPKDWDTRIKVNVDDISKSMDRILTIASEEGNNTVRMSVYEDKLSMSTETAMGNIHEELDISINGKNLEITFNIRYIIDVLKHLESDVEWLNFSFTQSSNPCVITPVDNEDFTYLVLPIRMY